MIPNLNGNIPGNIRRTKAFRAISDSKFCFYFTGSHFLGAGDKKSDYDFFGLKARDAERFLESSGFRRKNGMRGSRYVCGKLDVFLLPRRSYYLYHRTNDMLADIPWIANACRDARVAIANAIYEDLKSHGWAKRVEG